MSVRPYSDVSLYDIYRYISSEQAKEATENLRKETNEDVQKKRKVLDFNYCTPNGTFTYRNAAGLKKESGLIVLDFDHIDDHEELMQFKQDLLSNPHLPIALAFVSPRGKGLKVFVEKEPFAGKEHLETFHLLSDRIQFNYGFEVDQSGKDITRACFLPHDPDCYINPKYKIKNQSV